MDASYFFFPASGPPRLPVVTDFAAASLDEVVEKIDFMRRLPDLDREVDGMEGDKGALTIEIPDYILHLYFNGDMVRYELYNLSDDTSRLGLLHADGVAHAVRMLHDEHDESGFDDEHDESGFD